MFQAGISNQELLDLLWSGIIQVSSIIIAQAFFLFQTNF
jgi:hypothetical protein